MVAWCGIIFSENNFWAAGRSWILVTVHVQVFCPSVHQYIPEKVGLEARGSQGSWCDGSCSERVVVVLSLLWYGTTLVAQLWFGNWIALQSIAGHDQHLQSSVLVSPYIPHLPQRLSMRCNSNQSTSTMPPSSSLFSSSSGLHKLWYPGIRDTSMWSKFGAHGEHGDVFLFSNLGAL